MSHVIAKDGSRFVIVLSERKKNIISLCLLIAVCTEKIKRELYFIGWLMTSVASLHPIGALNLLGLINELWKTIISLVYFCINTENI